MAYQAPISIKEAMDNIKKGSYLLPSIQREFVWDTDQIETLFDSLMRHYPISTFLFWQVDKTKIKDFKFYEFLRHYHEKTGRHNTKAELDGDDGIIALLDGQQRMTSLYIALLGSYAKKAPYQRWDNPNAFLKRKLYLNLINKPSRSELEFDFRFFTENEATNTDKDYWFDCSLILDMTDVAKSTTYAVQNVMSKYTQEQTTCAITTLSKFVEVIHIEKPICFYLEKGEELDKVLQIFIRINAGGTKLSYSDLLLSIATAQWKEKDAREVIHEFVDTINAVGEGFSFNKDFVLKSCLVLADFKDVAFKVDNFNTTNMATIESNWEQSSLAVKTAVELVDKLGYNRDNLLSGNAVIPIAYYILKNNCTDKIVNSTQYAQSRKLIGEWLARALFKGAFSGQADTIYGPLRTVIAENIGDFPLEAIIEKFRGKSKSIVFTEDDIDSLLDLQYGKPRTYCALSLLYKGLNYSYRYHQDHIHPQAMFNARKMRANGYTEELIEQYGELMNSLPNLQLLQVTENIEKSDQPFIDWLTKLYPIQSDRDSYLIQNSISTETNLEFDNFLHFHKERKALLKNKLSDLLNVSLENEVEIKAQ